MAAPAAGRFQGFEPAGRWSRTTRRVSAACSGNSSSAGRARVAWQEAGASTAETPWGAAPASDPGKCRARCAALGKGDQDMQRSNLLRTLTVGSMLIGLSGLAAAQWVFLARQAIGRVEQMQQSSQQAAGGSGASYDVATVIVDVAPAKVFDTVKSMLGKNTEVKVTRTDEARRSVEFTDGRQIGGIQVTQLGDNLAQLMVSTAHPGIATSTTSTIVERILNVCKELGVACQRSGS
jgi:hypothetical protein